MTSNSRKKREGGSADVRLASLARKFSVLAEAPRFVSINADEEGMLVSRDPPCFYSRLPIYGNSEIPGIVTRHLQV